MEAPLTILEISVLDWFDTPRSGSRIAGYGFWDAHDGPRPDVSGAIGRLISSGHLRELSPAEKLIDLDNPSLKSELKSRGLTTSGNKKELISRLVDALSAEELIGLTEGSDLLEATMLGRSALESARKSDDDLCASAVSATLGHLATRDVAASIQAVLGVAVTRGGVASLVPRSFRRVDDPPRPEELTALFTARPGSLDGVDDSTLDSLRTATAMFVLWGEDPAAYVRVAGDAIGLPHQVAVNHLWSEARRRGEASGHKGAVVLDNYRARDPLCGKCSDLVGRSFPSVDQVPRLPLAGCMTTGGCPLHLSQDWDDDSNYDEVEIDIGQIPSPVAPADLSDSLREASRLRDEGLITEDEFAELRSGILRRLGGN